MTNLRESFRFMHEWAGYSTPPGKAVCAIQLARSERLLEIATDEGIASLDWEWDDFPYDDGTLTGEEIDAKFQSGEWFGPLCAILRVSGKVVASLGGIVVGRDQMNDPYCRVVAAELAWEAEDDIRQALGDSRDAREGVCFA